MIETQLLGEEAPRVLDGETQMLDDPLDCVATDHNPGGDSSSLRTQPMDEYQDTEVVEDDEQGTEGTLILSDDDAGLSDDDAATPCGVGCKDGRGETDGSSKGGTRIPPPGPCISEQGKREFPVASEVSAGEEGGSGPERRRSFTEVRAASLRASGLAAAYSTTPRTIDAERSPTFCTNHNREEQDDGLVAEQTVGAGERYAGLTRNIEKYVENSDKCMQNGHMEESRNRSGNLIVRKLNFEEAISGGDESTTRMAENRNSTAPHLLSSDYSVAGLSYVDSQEPGEQSQADALGAIDKFLSINDLGFSQEVNPNKTCGAKTPISSARRAHLLAKRGGPGSPVGKAGIFDWVDTLEDEGGGDFFSKRKDSFFGNGEHLKKTRTKLLKSRHCDSILAGGAYDKTRKTEGIDPQTDVKTIGLTVSESRSKLHNSVSDKIWASQVKASRTLCKEIAGQLNEDSTVQHVQKTDVGRGEENTYDIGPDTQMAAEAMEALIHGPFADNETQNVQSDAVDIVGGSSACEKKMKATSQHISLNNRRNSSSDQGGGSIRRSKRTKMLHAEANSYSSNSSKESLKSSKMKIDLRRRARMESENAKTEELLCTLKVQRKSRRSSTSLKIVDVRKQVLVSGVEEVVKRVVVNGSEQVDGCAGLLAPNDIISFSRKHVQRENNLSVTPVAHRTRRSINTVERLGTLSKEYEQRTKDLMEVRTVPAKRKQRGITANAPQQLLDQGKDSNQIEHDKNMSSGIDVEKIIALPERPCSSNALLGVTLGHQKRRRTHKSKSSNSTLVAENADVSLKSEKNKSRMSAALLPSETDIIHHSVKGTPGVRRRSSIKSHPYTSEGDGMQGSNADILTRASSSNGTHSTSIVNEKVPLREVEPATSFACFDVKRDVQLISDAQDVQGNTRLKGSPEERVQPPGATSMTPENKLESPVCTSVDPLRASNRKGLSKSLVARELIRLESMGLGSVLKSKDLRRRRDITSVCVCLSNHLDDDIIKHQKKILARLGVSIVARVSDATHFVADKFVRTKNMLEAMAVGKPVVTHLWVESCGQASCFIDEKNYILRDVKKEREIGFSMTSSLACARQRPLLEGKRVFITPNVKPGRDHVADLVGAAQGQPIERLGRSAIKDEKVPDDLLVISCEEDFAICTPLLEKGAEVFSSELLLNGIVIQKLEYERHRLFSDHIKMTRSTIWLRKGNGPHFLPVTRCT